MLLSVDIGNTNIAIGVFEDNSLVEKFRLPSDKNLSINDYELLLKTYLKNVKVLDCVIGSVVDNLGEVLKSTIDKAFGIDSLLINPQENYGMEILLKNPNKVGVDRIANAYFAKKNHSLPAIVVDIGTATTFDVVSKNGDFIGGVIMPGLNLQLNSLNSNTSKLPKINLGISMRAIGDSTEEALLSGVVRGSACAIEGLISQCELELGEKATIIATGGDCQLISKSMTRNFDFVNPDLTLEGLKQLYEFNKNRHLG